MGSNVKSMTYSVLCMWNCVQGADTTYTCKQLGLEKKIVMRYYRTARRIMAWDAERRQSELVFGCLPGGQTTDVEADEACFFSYSEDNCLNQYFDEQSDELRLPAPTQSAGTEEAAETQTGDKTATEEGAETQTGDKTTYFYVWLGVYERGTQKLWLKELGLKKGKKQGRPPPLSPDLWRKVCMALFRSDANIVLMTDSALAYTLRPLPNGIVDAHHVNHSRKPTPELSRSVEALGNVSTGAPRPAVCSTNLIDPTWRTLKEEIPSKGNVSARTAPQRQRMREYIRTGQWKVMMSTYDRWGPFCAAAQAYEELGRGQVLGRRDKHVLEGRVSKMAKRVPAAAATEPGPLTGAAVSSAAAAGDGAADVTVVPAAAVAASATPVAAPFRPITRDAAAAHLAAWGDRYFERQSEAKCGRHAVNNLVGGPQYIDQDLDKACSEVAAELGEPLSLHCGRGGWYSISVLAKLFDMTSPCQFVLSSSPALPDMYQDLLLDDGKIGILVNVGNVHWVCMCKHAGKIFYVDSCYAPSVVDASEFGHILKQHPMSFHVSRNVVFA